MSRLKVLAERFGYLAGYQEWADDLAKMDKELDELSTLRTQLKSVEAERDQYKHEAEMWDEHMGPLTDYEGDEAPWQTIEREYSTLKEAHESLLLRLQEAEWLIRNAGEPSWRLGYTESSDWLTRRDTFLNPKPQDVK